MIDDGSASVGGEVTRGESRRFAILARVPSLKSRETKKDGRRVRGFLYLHMRNKGEHA